MWDLSGIPVLLKDIYDTADTLTSGFNIYFADSRPSVNAPTFTTLLFAGSSAAVAASFPSGVPPLTTSIVDADGRRKQTFLLLSDVCIQK